jgi:hypothetical protein
MNKKKKIILYSFAGCFLLLQFLQPARTRPEADPQMEFLNLEEPPADIAKMIRQACYDCHSYNTRYPWYSYLSPLSWWIQGHIDHGRHNLNFSEWGTYSASDRKALLKHSAKEIDKGSMPLESYLPMHPEARLTDGQKRALVQWFFDRSGK